MPEFRKGSEMVGQHKEIHKGLDGLREYLEACRRGDEDLELAECGKKLEGWGEVLWKHLEEEERMLGAEEMRRVWSVEEVRGLAF
jgi:hemerythrin-like domain-containing protein